MSTTNEATTAAPAAHEPVKDNERAELRHPVRNTDFKEKYPPDRELGHELDDTARVWKVYRGEAIDHDDALLKTWNETVNMLLTFAGLFSAAVTSFVVASTDDLKPDPNAYIANLLFTMGNASEGSASTFAHLPVPPPLEATPTSLARVVNGLWFTSLFLSLAAALLCIVVKQWLDEYTARTRSSAKHAHEWAQRRSVYFQGLVDWKVAAIISFLPLLLHLALFLFLAGLTAFLWNLDSDIRWLMLVLVSLLLTLYAVSLLIPIWSAACPYATPLLVQLRALGYTALISVYIVRKWALLCRDMILPGIYRSHDRRPPGSQSASLDNRSYVNSYYSPDHLGHLLGLRRQAFERVLKTHEDMSRTDDFAGRLDCSVISWLIYNVSDSDAVAVAWQSLSALIKEPGSQRCTAMSNLLRDYRARDIRNFRMDEFLDDMQLCRIARSALFLEACLGVPQLRDLRNVLTWSDEGWLHRTLPIDVLLIYAHSIPSEEAAQVMHRLHGNEICKILSSTPTPGLLFHRVVPHYTDFAPDAVIASMYFCNIPRTTAHQWTHVAHIFHSAYGDAEYVHQCDAHCVVNTLAARALVLAEDEMRNSPNPSQIVVAPFNAYSHVQLITRILRAVSNGKTELSAAVWTVLTRTQYFQSRVQPGDRIRGYDWANALHKLGQSSNRFYESFATQYNLTWSMLLRGFLWNHPNIALDEGIDFGEDAGNASWELEEALRELEEALRCITPWQIEISDSALRPARLRSALTLAESASMAICSVDRNDYDCIVMIRFIVPRIHLVSILPTNIALTEEEHTEWVELFASTVQHLVALDPPTPLPWNGFRDAVTASTDDDIRTFFNKVHARLTELGPCTKGPCGHNAPTDSEWLSVLGPTI